ncbi:MAG TPA: BtpA/SgcQ family protein [Tepidisphaeraceae bacterium]|nr:BtpA/SgcQ family protein [Tepidisphaeraceae bacterium]
MTIPFALDFGHTIHMSVLVLPWSNVRKVVVGMVHLLALPGSPRFGGDISAIRDAAVRDAEALAAGGVHGIMVENFGDVPFYPGRVPVAVVAHMTAIVAEIRRRVELPLGINVLRNDGQSALAVAHAAGASFIRINVLCGARVTDQGIVQGIAHELLRERVHLGAADVKIFADVDVKHSAPLAPRPLADEVTDTIARGLADAVIVSGAGTGKPTDPQHVRAVKAAAGHVPVLVGSGISGSTVQEFDAADGFIAGTSFKRDADVAAPVDVARVKEFLARVQ